MRGQHSRVAAWGPSPQYVSMNSVDAYGRTVLDIALMRYFACPLPPWSERLPGPGSERQKAVDILREFVHRIPPSEPGVVCGWELLHVLRFLDVGPTKKAGGSQIWDPDRESGPPAISGSPTKPRGPDADTPYGDTEELLQAVRVLVRSGARTQWLLQELVRPPSRGSGCSGTGSHGHGGDIEVITACGTSLCRERTVKYSAIDQEDFEVLSVDDTFR